MSVRRVARSALELLFPPRCQICGRFCRTAVCADCRAAFEELAPPICAHCGAPLPEHVPPAGGDCADCRNRRTYLMAVRSAGLHRRTPPGVLREAVNRLKFRGRLRIAEPLARFLAPLLTEPDHPLYLPDADAITDIVPVPLHRRRHRERGYNQAELIATALGSLVGLPVKHDILARTRDTVPQVSLEPRQRAQNVRNAFTVTRPLPKPGVTVLLVDDVYTTGATLEACGKTLLAAGADGVYGITVSRPSKLPTQTEREPQVDGAPA